VSADTIGPEHGNPQMRNRYSYALNNPLKFADPTGHCSESAQTREEREENARCAQYDQQLAELGIDLSYLYNWLSSELALVLQGAWDLIHTAGWSISEFKNAIGGYVILVRDRRSNLSGFEDGGVIKLGNGAFNQGDAWAKRTVVHELGHRWDEASGGRLSSGLVTTTEGKQPRCYEFIGYCRPGYVPGDRDHRPSPRDPHYDQNKYEDFAESVAATVYGSNNPTYAHSKRDLYVRQQFYNYGGYPPPDWRERA
jgi:hypothetical protein